LAAELHVPGDDVAATCTVTGQARRRLQDAQLALRATITLPSAQALALLKQQVLRRAKQGELGNAIRSALPAKLQKLVGSITIR
jgi:hypothetical protein